VEFSLRGAESDSHLEEQLSKAILCYRPEVERKV